MARLPRLLTPGFHHVMSRGNDCQAIYLDDGDRSRFLAMLRTEAQSLDVLCHDFCLMETHYHLLLETVDAHLSRMMQRLNGRYATSFNRRHRRVGHLFQGRFKSKPIRDDLYLQAVSRYIALNPINPGRGVSNPGDWPWSSYRAHAGLAPPPPFLTEDRILGLFNVRNTAAARRAYRKFVCSGLTNSELTGGDLNLGSAEFVDEFIRPTLGEIFVDSLGRKDRDQRICAALFEYGYTMTELAKHLGMHPRTISRVTRSAYPQRGRSQNVRRGV